MRRIVSRYFSRIADKFCSFCGNQHKILKGYAGGFLCDKCNNITYKNPLPVSVILQPVILNNGSSKGLGSNDILFIIFILFLICIMPLWPFFKE